MHYMPRFAPTVVSSVCITHIVLEAYSEQKFKFEKLERASLRGRSYVYARVSKLKALRFCSHKFLWMNRSPQLALAMTNKRVVLAH